MSAGGEEEKRAGSERKEGVVRRGEGEGRGGGGFFGEGEGEKTDLQV